MARFTPPLPCWARTCQTAGWVFPKVASPKAASPSGLFHPGQNDRAVIVHARRTPAPRRRQDRGQPRGFFAIQAQRRNVIVVLGALLDSINTGRTPLHHI